MLSAVKKALHLRDIRRMYKELVRTPIRRSTEQQLRRIERWKHDRPIHDGQAGHDIVREAIARGPAAVGKIGSSELVGVVRYLKYRTADGTCDSWGPAADRLTRSPGIFPRDSGVFRRFVDEFLDALGDVDVLGVWYNPGEAAVAKQYAPRARLVGLESIEPHLWERPWVEAAAGKRVLLISPFADTARTQHGRLKEVWQKKPGMAPDFELLTIRTPLQAALVASPYATWGDGLDDLRNRMSDVDFDIAVIGAGAWSLPLAAHARKMGRVGVHLGGPTQLLFGIRGGRWETWSQHNQYFTESWVRPSGEERPEGFARIEGGGYW